MKPVGKMTQAELGAYVQSHLMSEGIDVVLSGGAAVAFYTSGEYVSNDIDLINQSSVRRRQIQSAMEELGFLPEGRHFVHLDSEFFVEFPPGPLGFGDQPATRVDEIRLETGILRVISPTDCVKDRLAWYFHYGDTQCLAQASMVSRGHPIDVRDVEKWSEAEGKLEEFEAIRTRLTKS